MMRLALGLLLLSGVASAQVVIPDNGGKPIYESPDVMKERKAAQAKKRAEYQQILREASQRAAEAKAAADAERIHRRSIELGR
jgi:hypothetical protein